MTSNTTNRLRYLVNRHLKTLHSHSLDLKKSLIEFNSLDTDNLLFSLETSGEEVLLKSYALKFFPKYEERIVVSGDYVLFKGTFFVSDNDKKIELTCFYIDIHGRVAVNNLDQWTMETDSPEVFTTILDSLFDSAIENKLISV